MKVITTFTAKKNTACRYCHSTQLSKFLSLGDQPPSNSFIPANKIHQEKVYPLDVYFCKECFLVQLIDVVPAEIIFDDYLYLSSSSKALKNHYANLTKLLTSRFNLKKNDVVIDIGCNDGILLHGYTKPGLVKVGVEPSRVAEVAKASGLEVIKAFFDGKVASQIIKKHGTAKIVTATNVFAHVDDIETFTKGISSLLGKDGVFVIEAPYLIDLIDQTLFDTVYHEHLCYLSLTPMVAFFERLELEVFDVERVSLGASGPALRVFVQKKGGRRPVNKAVNNMFAEEKKWGVGDMRQYQGYAKKIENVKTQVLKLIAKIKKSGARLGGYGAPAKGNTLLNYFGITPDIIECIAETNKVKQGLVTPGTHIPIVSEEEFIKRMPEYALLLTWNYLDFFLEKSEYLKKGGKFLVPLPQPKIAP
jgi:hypothetical protein